MPRQPRIEYEGAVYHIISRGNRGESIFQNEQDLEMFEKTLGEACEKSGFVVCAYTLMYNHYHLVMETPEANLVSGMQWLQSTYTQRYHSRHQTYGHLFQGRYKSIVVDGNDPFYFQNLCDYVHLNPARAHLVGGETEYTLADYPWSSSWYLAQSPENDPDWLDLKRICEIYAPYTNSDHLRQAYLERLENRLEEEKDPEKQADAYREIRNGWALGGEAFKTTIKERMVDQIRNCKRSSHTGVARRLHDVATAVELIDQGLELLVIRKDDLYTLKKNDTNKYLIAWLLRRKTPVKLAWIAEMLHMGGAINVSRGVKTVQESDDPYIRERRKRLLDMYECAR